MDNASAVEEQYHYSRPHPLDERVRIVNSARGLQAIHYPGVKAVIWTGRRTPEERAMIDRAGHEKFISLTHVFSRQADAGNDPVAALFNAEIQTLTALYNSLAPEPISANPENVLVTNHYHEAALGADADWPEHHAELGYELRLLSAFAGRGTEWIAGDMTYKELLQLNRQNLTENAWGPARHQYTGSGDVLVLKGDGYKGCAKTEQRWSPEWLVHREPMPQPGVPRAAIIMPYS